MRGAFCFDTEEEGVLEYKRERADELNEWAKATRRPWRRSAGRHHTENHDPRPTPPRESRNRRFLRWICLRGSACYLSYIYIIRTYVISFCCVGRVIILALHGERPPEILSDAAAVCCISYNTLQDSESRNMPCGR